MIGCGMGKGWGDSSGSQIKTPAFSSIAFSLTILRQGLSLNWKHVVLPILPGLGTPACLCPPMLELQTHAAMTFYASSREGIHVCRFSLPQVCRARVLIHEPPAQPFIISFQSQYLVHLEVLRETEEKREIFFIFTKQTWSSKRIIEFYLLC